MLIWKAFKKEWMKHVILDFRFLDSRTLKNAVINVTAFTRVKIIFRGNNHWSLPGDYACSFILIFRLKWSWISISSFMHNVALKNAPSALAWDQSVFRISTNSQRVFNTLYNTLWYVSTSCVSEAEAENSQRGLMLVFRVLLLRKTCL